MVKIDKIDRKIIELLKRDGRMSYRKIAEEIGRTEVTVRRRVRKLIKEGVIRRFTVVIDPVKIGKSVQAFISVPIDVKEISKLVEKLRGMEEVSEAYFLAGRTILLLKINVEDLGALSRFLEEKLEVLGETRNVETYLILKDLLQE
ncbi:MAG: Lrp/AsnC family transcriptional regulator [Candidatus Odinarchaeota archaeon]|nr:Lrp/AsnC family transcriptional regulator [Candidatus Odinarchaeota archaeon]